MYGFSGIEVINWLLFCTLKYKYKTIFDKLVCWMCSFLAEYVMCMASILLNLYFYNMHDFDLQSINYVCEQINAELDF